jgi:hypothetical protein
MNLKQYFVLLFALFCANFDLLAQPANNTCANAITIPVTNGSCSSPAYTNVGATTVGNPPTPSCWSPNNMSHTVWFNFVATSTSVEISTNFGFSLTNTQIAVYSGTCGSLTPLACNEDINNAGGLLHTSVQLHGLTVGNTYYIIVDGNGTSTGEFGVCAQEILPIGPPLPIQDCATAQFLCNTNNINIANGTGGPGLVQEQPSCFGAPGERASWWYTFTAANNGTLCFEITPNAGVDYDFAVFNTTNGCIGTQVACDWTGTNGVTGLGCGTTACDPCINVTAGQTYSILIDRFTASSSAGFTLDFTGTVQFASPNPSFTSTGACVGSPVQFTNTTPGSNTYSWNFGDGNTSSATNPTHTYAAAGTYNVTLLVTTNPGGCQNVVSQNVVIAPLPTANAGADTSVCSGACVNLSGTSSVTPGTFATTVTNPNTIAIANNNTTGSNSTVTTTGIVDSNSTIGSICFTLTHGNFPDIGNNGNANAITITMPDGTVYNSTLTPLAAGGGTRTYCIPAAVYAGYTGTLNGTFTLNVKDTRGGGGSTGSITSFTVVINTNTVQWSPTTGMTGANTLTPNVCPVANTTYTLTVVSPSGCVATDTVLVSVSPAATMVLTSGSVTQTTCVNVAIVPIQFTVGGGATGATISAGSLPPGVSGNFAAGVFTISGIPNLAGIYNYTVSTTGGCSAPVTISGTIEVTGAIVPITGFSYTTPVCSNNANILPALAPSFTSGGTFSALPAGLIINSSTGEINVSSSTPGAYTVTYNFPASACGLAASSNAPITITLLPTATISYVGTPFCTSVATAQGVTLTGTGAFTGGTYTASPAGLTINASTGAITPSTSTAGTYTVTYTIPASGGCPAIPVTTSVVITELPTATISYAGPFCNTIAADQLVTLNGTGFFSSGTFSATPAGLTLDAATGNISPISSTPGVYTVTYTIPAVNGCSEVLATTSVTITAAPTAVISYAGTPFCTSLATAQAVTLTGTGAFTGGTYSSTAGLTINTSTGAITPSTSTAGTYTVTYTIPASGGCPAVPVTTSVTITAAPTAIISYAGTPFCTTVATAQAVTLTGTGAFTGGTYTASPAGLTINASTGAITPSTSTAGTYTVTYTIPASAGCAAVPVTTSVTITAAPTATISYSGTPFCTTVATAQGVTLTGTGAFTGGTYTASPAGLTINASTGAITPSTSTAGTYTVTYTIPASAGCAAVPVTTSVTITAAPTAVISYAGTPFCTTVATAQGVTLTGTGAFTGGTYSSTAGLTINATTGAITPSTSTAGTYTVTYTIPASAGCAAVPVTTSVTITAAPTAVISYAGTPFCTTVATAQGVTLTGTGAFTGGTYSSTAGLTINASTGAITPSTSTAGTYTVTYTIPASAGCAAVPVTTSVTITAAPTAVISYAGTPFCTTVATAQGVTLTGTGAFTGGTYTASPAGLTINASTGAITPSTSTAGTYTVTYTIPASAGCAVVPVTTSVTITAVPTATISYAGTPFCTSVATAQGVTLTGTGAFTGGTYSSTAGLTINPTTGSITPSTSTAGTYTVTYTIPASAGCAAVPVTTSVTITAAPTAVISYAGTPFCTTVATAQGVTLTGTGAFTGGTYSSTAGLTINATTGAITPSTSTAGTYTVTYSIPASAGCAAVPVTTSVTITAAPTATISYVGTPFCSGTGTAAVTQIGTGGGIYSSSPGLVINASTGEVNLNTSIAGTYTVTYTIPANAGCAIFTTTTTITINPITTPITGFSYSTPVCINGINPLPTGVAGFTTGGVYSSTAGLAINSSTGEINLVTSTAGTYTVTYTVPATICGPVGVSTFDITLTAVPTATISYAGTPFCTTVATAQGVTLTGTGAFTGGTYTASPAGLTINATTGAITPSTSTAGTYTVTYTIPASAGCAAVPVTTSVTITAAPTAVISYAGTPFCTTVATAQAVTLTGTGAFTGGTYTASPAGLTINATTGAITPSTSTAGTYTVTYTIPASAGCAAVPVTTSVTITAAPTATISYAGTPFCTTVATAQGVTLTGTGAFTGGTYSSTAGLTINASTGAITPSTSTAGTYTVTYTIPASAGCAAVPVTTSVTITAAPTAIISYAGTPFCTTVATAQAVTLTGTGAFTGGTYTASPAGLTINASTGAITPSTSTAGTYTVTYTIPASAGCAAVPVTTSVTITAAPTATISYAGTPFCTTVATAQGVTLTGTGAFTGGTYSSTAGLTINATTGAITPSTSTAGTYTVTYSIPASAGCAAVPVTTSVTITAAPTATISYSGTPFCTTVATAQGVTLTGTGAFTGGTYSSTAGLTINATTGAITPSTSTAGTYTVTYTIPASAGCAAVPVTTSVTITAVPTATISYAGTPFCTSVATAQAVTLTGTGVFVGGTYSSTAGLTINASTGAITPSTSTAGTYIVTYTIPASAGCAAVPVTTTVTINAQPNAGTNGNVTICDSSTTTIDLFNLITGEQSGGTWVRTSGTGGIFNAVAGTFIPASGATTSTFTYTITASAPCVNSSSVATVNINAQPNAGNSNSFSVCDNDSTLINLSSIITGEQSGGIWIRTSGTGGTFNAVAGTFIPEVGATTSTFTYTITGISPCIDSSSVATINVTPSPTAAINYPLPQYCVSSSNVSVTLTGTGAYTGGTYTSIPSGLTINSITGEITPSTSTPGTYTVRYNIPASGPCTGDFVTTTITITPLPTVIATNLNPTFCSGGVTNIQLTSNIPGATFSWTVTGGNVVGALGGSGTSINQLLTVSLGTTSTVEVVYTIIAEANGCAGTPQVVRVQVNPIPDLTVASSTAPICSGETTNISFTGTIPGTVFSWVVTNVTGVAGASNGTGTSIQQTLTATGLAQGSVTYQITPTFNGCTGTSQSVTVLVNPRPELFADPTHPPLCSGESTFISVSTFNANTVLDWTVNAVGVNGALPGTNTGLSTLIEQTLTTTTNAQGYVDYIITPSLAGCSGAPITVRVYVNPLPLPTLTDGVICVDEFGVPFQFYTLDSGLDNATYDFVWYLDGVAIPNSNNATYTANTVGTYSVIATNTATNCESEIVSANVTSTTPATAITYTVTNAFSDNATITVNVTGGTGTLLYQLDDEGFQESNVFTGVAPGPHTVTVIDTQGCTYLTVNPFVIDYPPFFTPNGDGYNDTWNIVGLQDQPEARIYIFDRYGKLLKQLSPAGEKDGMEHSTERNYHQLTIGLQ